MLADDLRTSSRTAANQHSSLGHCQAMRSGSNHWPLPPPWCAGSPICCALVHTVMLIRLHFPQASSLRRRARHCGRGLLGNRSRTGGPRKSTSACVADRSHCAARSVSPAPGGSYADALRQFRQTIQRKKLKIEMSHGGVWVYSVFVQDAR
jgi:hypothetical protein